jgi:hypothetical protein
MAKYPKVPFSDFNEEDDGSGVLRLILSSWDAFHYVVKKFENYQDYLWRGQRCDGKEWSLKSSFDRRFPGIPSDERQRKLEGILENFGGHLRDLPRGRRTNAFTDDVKWAIGQHYGLLTPLLDWTECPYIAAYMAFHKKVKDQTDNRVVYALSKAVKLLQAKTKDSVSKELLRTERFVAFPEIPKNRLDDKQNKRLKAQKGKFTLALNGDDIAKNVRRLAAKGKYQGETILAEILIPDRFRGECLEYLRARGLTHGILFPDYSGAVEICKHETGV